MPSRKSYPMIKLLNSTLIDLPTPSNISLFWNFGSLLGLCLFIQIMSGLFLSMHYSPNIMSAFDSVCHISRNINYGWLLRAMHANTASLFFICLYCHIGRGLYYSSFNLKSTWISGMMIFLLTMITAFLGYVLPWGQMSFWGATVITNLLSAIPYLNTTLVNWIWGGFSVDNATLTRFYSLHFILPFTIIIFVIFHLIFLHQTGSSNPLGVNSNSDKIPFHPYFSLKDLMGIIITIFMLLLISLFIPNLMADPENFIPANPMSTPVHIQPEWYFLFAYAILRSIPNKLGGVCALLLSVLIILLMPIFSNPSMKTSLNSINQNLFWIFSITFILLTWVGAMPVEIPFIKLSQILSTMYFSFFLINPLLTKLMFKLI